MREINVDIVPLVFLTIGALVATAVIAVQEPVWVVGMAVIGGSLVATIYAGPWVTSVCVALSTLGVSGSLHTYAPSAGLLSDAAVVYLSALGVVQGIKFITQRRRPGKLFLPVSGYLGFCVLSTFISAISSPVFAARGFLALTFPVLVVFAVVGAITGSNQKVISRKKVVMSVVILALLGANSVAALRQAFSGFTGPELALIQSSVSTYAVGDAIRTMGLLPTNQDFGLLISCLAPATFVVASRLTGKYKAIITLIGVLAAIALVTSLTRTALIAASVALIIGIFAWGVGTSMSRTLKYCIGIGGSVTALWGWLSTSTNSRIQETYARLSTITDLTQDRSYTDRTQDVYPQAFRTISEHPFGAGAGSAGPVSQQFPTVAPFGSLTTDSGYLMIAVQIGIPGAIVLLWLLWRTLRALVEARTPARVAGAVAVLALAVAMTTAQYWSLSAPIALVAALVGIAFSDVQDLPPLRNERMHIFAGARY